VARLCGLQIALVSKNYSIVKQRSGHHPSGGTRVGVMLPTCEDGSHAAYV